LYTGIEKQLSHLGSARDALAAQMRAVLLGAAFGGKPLNGPWAATLIGAGQALLAQASALAK
jgi:hypothetical protein